MVLSERIFTFHYLWSNFVQHALAVILEISWRISDKDSALLKGFCRFFYSIRRYCTGINSSTFGSLLCPCPVDTFALVKLPCLSPVSRFQRFINWWCCWSRLQSFLFPLFYESYHQLSKFGLWQSIVGFCHFQPGQVIPCLAFYCLQGWWKNRIAIWTVLIASTWLTVAFWKDQYSLLPLMVHESSSNASRYSLRCNTDLTALRHYYYLVW